MDYISPKFPHLLFLSSLLIITQLFHFTRSSDLTYSPTKLQPYDRTILLEIQKHFGKRSQFWNSSSPECCVYCYDEPVRGDFDGHVMGLVLDSNPKNLYGVVPAAISKLTFLRDLSLTGPDFMGPIPPAIGKLRNLQFLAIVNTSMTGRIPGSLGRLRNLTRLNLSNNKFTGHLPKSLSQLIDLWEFDLSSNKLSGPIPDSLFTPMSSLLIVLLRSNRLSGPIPTSIRSLVNLQSLDLSQNALTGPIPDCFGSFKNAINLWLSDNRLTGSIPKSLGRANAWTLDLSGNQITDASYLFHKSDFGAIDINLSKNLLKFDFSNVQVSNSLNMLNISHNMIYGSPPKQLAQLPYLVLLDVSYNQLCGPIPDSPKLKRFSPANFAHNKCLCGAPLPPCK